MALPMEIASMASKAAKNPYAVHPGVAMVQGWIETLPAKTGRSLDQWKTLIRKQGLADEKAGRAWLKAEHGMGTNIAGWLAERAFSKPGATWDDDPDEYLKMAVRYVDGQYAGKKQSLRPIYDELLKMGLAIGKESKACPCKTIVPLYRQHVFAQIKPTTNTRVDLGLALAKFPGQKIPERIIDTGGKAKKDRITHRIPIESLEQIDGFVERWLRTAYDLDAK